MKYSKRLQSLLLWTLTAALLLRRRGLERDHDHIKTMREGDSQLPPFKADEPTSPQSSSLMPC
eukprot:3889513-Pleurochrysis_carterae.AAC.1